MATTRLAKCDDLADILDIANRAIRNTASNFNVQALTFDDLAAVWKRTQEHYPWLVAIENDNVLAYALASPSKARAADRWAGEVCVCMVYPLREGRGGVGWSHVLDRGGVVVNVISRSADAL